jgi:hypothetical protein
LLLQRALPELGGFLESSREAFLKNSRQLISQLKGQLQGIQGSLDTLFEGRVLVKFTGYFGAGPTPASTLAPISVSTASSVGTSTGMPIITALARVFTVPDVWKEWAEGFAGRPAIRELKET